MHNLDGLAHLRVIFWQVCWLRILQAWKRSALSQAKHTTALLSQWLTVETTHAELYSPSLHLLNTPLLGSSVAVLDSVVHKTNTVSAFSSQGKPLTPILLDFLLPNKPAVIFNSDLIIEPVKTFATLVTFCNLILKVITKLFWLKKILQYFSASGLLLVSAPPVNM